jgi:hypothetical protein
MTLQIATIIDAITDLTVSGMTLYDIHALPQTAVRIYPCLIPRGDFLSNMVCTRQSFNVGSVAKTDYTYNLNFRLLYAPVGAGRGIMDYMSDMLTAIVNFVDKIKDTDYVAGSAIDIQLAGIPVLGVVTDPADMPYYGADFTLSVLEFDDA